MRSHSWLAALAVVAFAVSACAGSSPTASPTDTPATPTAESSASAAPSEEPTEEPTEQPIESAAAGDELDFRLEPNSGTTELTSGFTPDPFSIDLRSGGLIDASYLGDDCSGSVTAAPDYDVRYTAGSQSLLRIYFVADSFADTTLIINAPDGSWHCNDDAPGRIDPQVDFEDPASGLYDVWVGSYEAGTVNPGTLYVTESATNQP